MKNMNPFERGVKEPYLIAGRYTLKELTEPNRRAVRE